MKKRLRRKIVKKYGDSWWKVIEESETHGVYILKPPSKWNTKEIIDEFHRQKRGSDGIYWYKISL